MNIAIGVAITFYLQKDLFRDRMIDLSFWNRGGLCFINEIN